MPLSNTEANQAEERFIAEMAAKLPDQSDTPDPSETPAPAAVTADAPATATAEPESTSHAPAAGDAEADEQDPPAPAATPARADAPATEPESDDDEDDDGEEEDEEEAHEPSAAFREALEREGAKLTLDDVPEAARPFVQQRVRELEAGFTKARQRDTAAIVELRAEQRFQREHAADYIAAQLRANPKLADEVNALIDEFEQSPTAARAHEVIVRDQRAAARTAEEGEVATAEAQQREVEALEAHLQSRLTEHGVKPGKALARMLADAATLAEKTTGKRALTRETIDTIVADYAGDVKAEREHARKLEKRVQRSRYVQDKVADRATAGLAVPPKAGAPPAPAAAPKPKTDEEFIASMAARL
jgi:hypothetical protein